MRSGITITRLKGDRLRHMLIITSNAYRDREDEIIKEIALKQYVESPDIVHQNKLLYWHDGDPIGQIIHAEMIGPFLVEVAMEIPNKAVNVAAPDDDPLWTTVKAMWDVIEEEGEDWAASHGFKYRKRDKENNEYREILKFETSVLPRQHAANKYTLSEVI